MRRRLVILILLLTGCCTGLLAQYDSQITNYWAAMNYFNPGYAGQGKNLELTALQRMQWVGIENAPVTTVVLAEMPYTLLGREHGVGLSMFRDQYGFFSSNVVSGQYAFKAKLLGGMLGVGLQGGYITQSFDGEDIELPEDEDGNPGDETAVPTSKLSGNAIDAAFGLFYAHRLWYIGLSATHLLAPKLELGDNYVLEIPRSYYFTAGYNIRLRNPFIELRPSVLIKTTEPASVYVSSDSLIPVVEENMMEALWKQTQIDVSMRAVYRDRFWGGLSWRKDDAVIVMLGGKFKNIQLGYAYDFPISKIRQQSTGSHELFLKYSMDLNLNKKKKDKHKSVRIL